VIVEMTNKNNEYQCLSCLATYDSLTDGGYKYFHACVIGTVNPRNENVIGGTGKNKDDPIEKGKGRKKLD